MQNQVTAPAAEPVVTPAVETTPPVEVVAAPEPEKVEPKEDPKFAARFAALTRKEQAIRAQEAKVKEAEAFRRTFEEDERLAKENPLKWLEKRGHTYDKLTQLALNDGSKPADMQIQELREQIEREKREAAEAAAKEAEETAKAKTQEFLTGVGEFLDKHAEKYELLKNHDNGPELVLEVMHAHKAKHGRILSVDEACGFIEKHFEDELESRYSKINKIKNKFGPQVAPPPADPLPQAKPQSPTLTNTQAATVPTPSTRVALSPEESKREAAKLLKWV